MEVGVSVGVRVGVADGVIVGVNVNVGVGVGVANKVETLERPEQERTARARIPVKMLHRWKAVLECIFSP